VGGGMGDGGWVTGDGERENEGGVEQGW
jgi:hypothetical protein